LLLEGGRMQRLYARKSCWLLYCYWCVCVRTVFIFKGVRFWKYEYIRRNNGLDHLCKWHCSVTLIRRCFENGCSILKTLHFSKLLLILYGHGSHFSLGALNFCR
jgi:hypothetical protein